MIFYPFSVKFKKCLKCTKNRLAAGLPRPDPLGAPPDHLAAIWGPTSKGRGKGGEEEGRGRREVTGRRGGKGRRAGGP